MTHPGLEHLARDWLHSIRIVFHILKNVNEAKGIQQETGKSLHLKTSTIRELFYSLT
jgi:hypothetical protein